MYYLTEKIKGKIYGIATWEPDTNQSCLATARHAFNMHGLDGRVSWDYIATQKNFKGMKSNAIVITSTIAEVNKWSDIQMAKEYKYHFNKTYEYFHDNQSTIDMTEDEWNSL